MVSQNSPVNETIQSDQGLHYLSVLWYTLQISKLGQHKIMIYISELLPPFSNELNSEKKECVPREANSFL